MSPEEIARRTGRPVPKPIPSVAELIKEVVSLHDQLGGKISSLRQISIQSSLLGIKSNLEAEVQSIEIDKQIKANQQAAEEAAKALSQQTTPPPVGTPV